MKSLESLLLVAVACSACNRKPREAVDLASTPAPSAIAGALPLDRLAPGEVAQGTERAFGLPLPRGYRVKRFDSVVYASGHDTVEQVTDFVRRRVDTSLFEMAPNRSVFPRVHALAEPGGPLLRIEIAEGPGGVDIVARDITPHPVTPALAGASEEKRWLHEGLRADGHIADPDHTF